MNAMQSAMQYKRFKQEMTERKDQLAFKLAKIYFVKKHSRKIYKSLV